jgi:hypothetical protein
MKNWLRRARGAIGMGVTWAIGWALAGLLIGITSKVMPFIPLGWFFNSFDAPLPALAIPGFICGVFFSLVLGIAARRRTFQQLSMTRFVAWGVLGGLMVTVLPFALAGAGLATINAEVWPLLLSFGGPLAIFGGASAALTLKLARGAEARALGSPPGQAALGHSDEDGVLRVDELHDHRSRVL